VAGSSLFGSAFSHPGGFCSKRRCDCVGEVYELSSLQFLSIFATSIRCLPVSLIACYHGGLVCWLVVSVKQSRNFDGDFVKTTRSSCS